VGHQQTSRFTPTCGAEPPARFTKIAVDGVLGDLQFPGDFLGLQMLRDEAQTLALTRRQSFDAVRW
jgi:hypothetical protein